MALTNAERQARYRARSRDLDEPAEGVGVTLWERYGIQISPTGFTVNQQQMKRLAGRLAIESVTRADMHLACWLICALRDRAESVTIVP